MVWAVSAEAMVLHDLFRIGFVHTAVYPFQHAFNNTPPLSSPPYHGMAVLGNCPNLFMILG